MSWTVFKLKLNTA